MPSKKARASPRADRASINSSRWSPSCPFPRNPLRVFPKTPWRNSSRDPPSYPASLSPKLFGPDGSPDALVCQGETKLFNPTINPADIDKEIVRDPVENTAEYLALFRSDIESYVTREVIEACTVPGRLILPYQRRFEGSYIAFTDPSGGRGDEMTLAIAHAEQRDDSDDFTVVLDYLTGSRVFSPDALVTEFCETIKSYHANDVYGDNYAAELTQELFNKNGVTYNLSEKNKGQIYSECIPILNSPGRCELLDDKVMAMQFVQLERRTARHE